MAAAEHVNVQVRDALSGRFGIIDYDPIAALGDIHLVGDFRRGVQKVSEQRHV